MASKAKVLLQVRHLRGFNELQVAQLGPQRLQDDPDWTSPVLVQGVQLPKLDVSLNKYRPAGQLVQFVY